MPGLVVFGRRWSVGSDDLVVPALFLVILHTAWLITVIIIRSNVNFDIGKICANLLNWILLSYLIILAGCIVMEAIIAFVSTRGSIIVSTPRESMHWLLYIRLGVMFVEVSWVVWSIVWLSHHYKQCDPDSAMKAVLGLVICCLMMIFSLLVAMWCTFDIAGRKWVRMKRFQESLKDKRSPVSPRFKRSSNIRRNWRQRKAIRAYEASWDKRFQFLCCCMKRKGRNKSSIAEISQLFTEFFRDLDVVPSDVIAGFLLLRRHQKMRQKYTVIQEGNDIYQYLSGISITPRTQFLSLRQNDVISQFRVVIHYMKFALAAYGWPMYVVSQGGLGVCSIMPRLSCFCCFPCAPPHPRQGELISDNCCHCNYAAMTKLINLGPHDVVYTTYHCDVGKTPFYIALDHVHRNVVIAIRGTLSLQDVLTDLKADCEPIPIEPIRDDWYGHKGIIISSVYIHNKLMEERLLEKAFNTDLQKGTDNYGLALVGHSLGAGTAAILAVLLRQRYPQLQCYAYSPPGGLMSLECVEDTKDYITSVVLGKDLIPRLGLHQMELLRTDLINVIKQSDDPKWQIIGRKLLCCCDTNDYDTDMDVVEMKTQLDRMNRDVTAHPIDSEIGLSAHQPLFPPGRIIHIVRSHPKQNSHCCDRPTPVYQAVWAQTSDFDEVLISPTMINDHMPDKVLEALEKTLVNIGPTKPSRILTESERQEMLDQITPLSEDNSTPNNINDDMEIIINEHNILIRGDLQHLTNLTNGRIGNAAWDDIAKNNPSDNDPSKLQLDIHNDWTYNAPLATPEALSASSSVVGINRGGASRDKLRLCSNDSLKVAVVSPILKKVSVVNNEQNPDTFDESRDASSLLLDGQVIVESGSELKTYSMSPRSNNLKPSVTFESDSDKSDKELTDPFDSISPIIKSPKRLDDLLKYIDDTSGTDTPDHKPVIKPDKQSKPDGCETDYADNGVKPDTENKLDCTDNDKQDTPNKLDYLESENVDTPPDTPKSRIKAFQSVKNRNKSEGPAESPRSYHQPLTHTESDSFIKNLANQMTMHRSKQEDNIVKLAESRPLLDTEQLCALDVGDGDLKSSSERQAVETDKLLDDIENDNVKVSVSQSDNVISQNHVV